MKSGNAVILRGGKEATHTNAAILRPLTDTLAQFRLPPDAVQAVPTLDRDAVGHLLKMSEFIDLVIDHVLPRKRYTQFLDRHSHAGRDG